MQFDQLKRREFMTLLGSAAAWPLAARAQQSERVRRIGWLDNARGDSPNVPARVAAVQQELQKLGWIVGRNLQIDHRWGAISPDTSRRLGADLLGLAPDVILCAGSPAVKALQQATTTVPIVFIMVAEPVDQGLVQSLSHPSGNITGFAYMEHTIGAKWLELLLEIAPKIKRVAYIFSPRAAPFAHFYYEAAEAAGEKIGVRIDINPVNEPAGMESILAHLSGDGGAIFSADGFIDTNLKLSIDLAARYGVPAIYGGGSSAAKAGGLISYNLDLLAQLRQVVSYLDRILRGEKPSDLPVQRPTKFQYAINLKTANALGLTVPLTLLAAADDVIE
jgi:putative ABC transport system substrate-binding protein